MINKEVLKDAGLTANESEIYLNLLKLGEATIYEISEHSKISRPNIYDIVNSLHEKNLASFIIKNKSLQLLGIILFFFCFLVVYTKIIDSNCMIKLISINKLRPGDWIINKIKIKNKQIKPNWEGLDEKEINQIQKHFKKNKKIKIKQGIPFSPVFLISLLILIYLWFTQKINLIFYYFF